VDNRLVVETSTSEATSFVVTGAAGSAFDCEGRRTVVVGFAVVFLAAADPPSSNALFALDPPHKLANNPAMPPLPASCCSPALFFFLDEGVLVDVLDPVPDDRFVGVVFLLLRFTLAAVVAAVSVMTRG
jgi:hypothetical protein